GATLSGAPPPAGSAMACCVLALAIDSQPASSATAVAESVAAPMLPSTLRRLVDGTMSEVDIGHLLKGNGSPQQEATGGHRPDAPLIRGHPAVRMHRGRVDDAIFLDQIPVIAAAPGQAGQAERSTSPSARRSLQSPTAQATGLGTTKTAIDLITASAHPRVR